MNRTGFKHHKPVRRAQLISPFGVGAMIDFPNDEALMTAGLEAWPHANEKCPEDWKIVEERLQERLGVDHFRLPPDYRLDDPDNRYNKQQIPFVRFPRWHYCPTYSCGKMVQRPLFGGGNPKCDAHAHDGLPDYRRPKPIPVRFVAVCPKGHIEDFPFMEWVHNGTPSEAVSHTLSYKAGKSAALSGIRITCSCGQKRTMGGAFNFDNNDGGALSTIGYLCRGNQPWLGITDLQGKNCGQHLRAVQRGGANVYFPRTFSSIYLPLWGEDTNAKVVKLLEETRIWDTLRSGLDNGVSISRPKCEAIADMRGVDIEELIEAAQRKLDGDKELKETTEEDFRRSEYEALRNARGDEATDLFVEDTPIGDYADWVGKYFEKICLVRKLRETRVLESFSRLLPVDTDDGPSAEGVQPLAAKSYINWLPAMIVRGEGLFFEFKSDPLAEWVKDPDVISRFTALEKQYNNARLARELSPIQFDPKFLLLHTFAHMLIRQLSYDCGYGSAALRERIYCNRTTDKSMSGILIYTAAGDSEGTMGGLVRQGHPVNLEPTLAGAIQSSKWCSSDPVCIESSGQGIDSANLAACHGCALLPETSCEEGNRLLDRGMIYGTPIKPELGYFSGFNP